MRTAAIAVVLLTLTSCASADNRATANLIPPELTIRQIGGAGSVNRNMTGPISVNYQVDVANRSAEILTLNRLEVQSVGEGAYTVGNQSRPFDTQIAPQRKETVSFWVPANAGNTISGQNGPVTLRVTAYFNSAVGKFREVYVLNINDTLGGGTRVD